MELPDPGQAERESSLPLQQSPARREAEAIFFGLGGVGVFVVCNDDPWYRRDFLGFERIMLNASSV